MVFQEVIEYYTRLQQQGEIESFEPVALELHGGDLEGFILIRGEREKLDRLRRNDEFMRLIVRGSAVVEHLGIVSAMIGIERVGQFIQTAQGNTADLT